MRLGKINFQRHRNFTVGALLWFSVAHTREENNLFVNKMPVNPLTPNDPYSGPTAPLTSKGCIL